MKLLKSNDICPLCGGKIPQEKIEEFESKRKVEESKIKRQLEGQFKEKLEQEKDHWINEFKRQKETFEEFSKKLEKQRDTDIKKIEKEYTELVKEKTKLKDEELIKLKKDLELAKIEEKKIRENVKNELKNEHNSEIKEVIEKKSEEIREVKKKYNEENEKLKSDLDSMKRQLDNKTSSELGMEGQNKVIDLLIRQFPRDDIRETKPGKPGSDIFHKVFHNGEEVGLIIYEVKNVSTWNNNFIDQAKEEKTRHGADSVILVTNVFPGKERLITKKEDILIVDPSKVAIIAGQIRDFLLMLHKSKLSNEEVEEKIKELQEYLTSTDYKNAIEDLFRSIKDWRDLREKEKEHHERHWVDEEKLNNKIFDKSTRIHTKISSIIESRLEKVPIIIKKKKNYQNEEK